MKGPSPSVGAKRRAETIPSTERICARCVSLYHLWYSASRSGEAGIVSTYMIPLGIPTPSLNARPRLDLQEATSVDAQLLAGDVARRVAGQEQHGLADVLGLDVRDRHPLDQRKDDLGLLSGRILQIGSKGLVHGRTVQHVGVDIRRVDRVHPDLLGSQSPSEVVHVVRDNLFRERIPGTAGSAVHAAG